MFIAARARRRELRQEFNVPASGQPHFTPKGVSICAGPMAINMQPLRGCWCWSSGALCSLWLRASGKTSSHKRTRKGSNS